MKKRIDAAMGSAVENGAAKRAPEKPRYSITAYLTVLVSAVLLIILLSYFIQLRNHSETIKSNEARNSSAQQKTEELQYINFEV